MLLRIDGPRVEKLAATEAPKALVQDVCLDIVLLLVDDRAVRGTMTTRWPAVTFRPLLRIAWTRGEKQIEILLGPTIVQRLLRIDGCAVRSRVFQPALIPDWVGLLRIHGCAGWRSSSAIEQHLSAQ
jgi:hypothetical protein